MKTALVLAGGGSRGAYQIGVWQALRELRITVDIVTGTSVGALNGALIAQDSFEEAVALWEEIDTSMVFDLNEKPSLTAYAKEFFKKGGAGSAPPHIVFVSSRSRCCSHPSWCCCCRHHSSSKG